MERLRQLIHEIHRRSLWQVLVHVDLVTSYGVARRARMFLRLCALSVLTLLAVSCGGGDSPTEPETPVATTVDLSSSSLSFTSLGASEQVTATVKDQNAVLMSGATVTWASSDEAIATVSSTGLVTSVGNGTATITATSGSASGSVSVTVEQVATSIALSTSAVVLAGPGDTAMVTATVMDAGGSEITSPSLKWSSDDEGIATVSSSGVVTAVAPGSVTVSVAVDDAMSNVPEATALVTVQGRSLEDLVMGFPEEGVPIDDEMLALIEDEHLVGASIAVMREGRLVMAQGYGWADLAAGAAAGPQTRFRLHSVSKMITGVAMLRAIDLGLVSLDDRPFDIFSDLSPLPGITEDPRIISVTIEQLLWFSSGLLYSYESPDHDCWRGGTLDKTQSIRCIRGLPLAADPGTEFHYTNDGHRLLARVIERASGLTYDEFVSEEVMGPGNAAGLSLIRARKDDRPVEEAAAYPFDWEDQWGVQSALDAWDGTGGWTGTPANVLRYLRAATGGGAQPSVLSDISARRLYERPAIPAWQPPAWTWLGPMHWSTAGEGAGQYEGIGENSYGGCMYYFHSPEGTSFVFATNTSPSDCWQIGGRLKPVVLAILAWPKHDLFSIVP